MNSKPMNSNLLSRTAKRDERVGPTAHYTAYAWFRLGMPYAEWFKTRRGAQLFWTMRVGLEWLARLSPGVPTLVNYLELRHRSIDHALSRLNPDLVVELGAGLSRRGVTWALDHGVRYVEVDLPHMVAAKRGLIAKLPRSMRDPLSARLELHGVDVLAEDFQAWLTQQLARSQRPVVIAEGLLGYLSTHERERVARAIAAALTDRGRGSQFCGALLCDLRITSPAARTRAAVKALRGAIRVATRGRGAREDFASNAAIEQLFIAQGFDSARPIEPGEVPGLQHLTQLEFPGRVWQFMPLPRGIS